VAHPTALVLNDDADTGEAISAILRGGGYDVLHARDGADALAFLRAGARPCIIVLDVMMPVMDGFSFREEQLRDPQLADIPVVVFSAVTDPQVAAARMTTPAYVRVPQDIGRLLEIVERHCLK
jgi:CheY-like chemotaxis protein